jgi:inner membrane transporter RhtA
MNLFFYEALDRIPLGVAVTIEFIGPVGVAVIFSRRPLDLVWVALAVTGILLLANPFGAGGVDRLGLVFVLLAALCWAVYIVLAQRASRVFSGSTGLAMAAVVAALVPLGPGLVEGGGDLLAPGVLAVGLALLAGDGVPAAHPGQRLRRPHEPGAGGGGRGRLRRARSAPGRAGARRHRARHRGERRRDAHEGAAARRGLRPARAQRPAASSHSRIEV